MTTAGRRTPIGRRFTLIAAAGAVGAGLFLPFLAAGAGRPVGTLLPFAIVAAAVAAAAAWPGLRLWDATGLPMPWLRRLEGGERPVVARRALPVTIASAVAFGLVALAALRMAHAPAQPGSLVARLLSAGFAAVTLEIVIHLFAMGLLVWMARGRRAVGIWGAAALLVAFHLTGARGYDTGLLIASIIGNGGGGLLFGWIGASFGFEYLVLAHAVAHLITVGAG